jgi:L,D-transpeptidase catalytic domain
LKSHFLLISLSFFFLPLHLTNKITGLSLPASGKTSFINTPDAIYEELNLQQIGLSQKAFNYAYRGYRRLVEKHQLANNGILSICDFTQSSKRKRLYILDLNDNTVLLTSYVAHGRGSGMEYATRFSNRANSHQSSLGFYMTGSTYFGEHGLSLRLQGLEPGFNDRAARRNIVVHGAPYASDEHLESNVFLGRSYGCPAVPQGESNSIINLIKNGTCVFLYYPEKRYLHASKILNG